MDAIELKERRERTLGRGGIHEVMMLNYSSIDKSIFLNFSFGREEKPSSTKCCADRKQARRVDEGIREFIHRYPIAEGYCKSIVKDTTKITIYFDEDSVAACLDFIENIPSPCRLMIG